MKKVVILLSILFMFTIISCSSKKEMVIELKSTQNMNYQLFYDIGKGFNQPNSLIVKVEGDDKYQKVSFDLDDITNVIRKIRIDPGSSVYVFEIKKIYTKGFLTNKEWDADDIVSFFDPKNHIGAFEVDGDHVRVESTGSDPYFINNTANLF